MRKILLIIGLCFISLSLFSCGNKNNINEVINLIDLLPDEITLEYENEINEITLKYNPLNDKSKDKVTNYDIFLQKKKVFDQLKEDYLKKDTANKIITQIDELPTLDVLKISDKEIIMNVSNEYNKLSLDVKVLVTNYSKLKELLNEVSKFDLVEEVIKLIIALPDENKLTFDDLTQVNSAREAFDSLDKSLQKYVGDYLNVLVKCEVIMEDISYKTLVVSEIIKLIDELPSVNEVTISDKNIIYQVFSKYENMLDSYKNLITNVDKLQLVKNRVDELIKIESENEMHKNNALKVINLINTIPDKVSISDKELLDKCVRMFDELLPIEKEMVTNYNKLEVALEDFAEIIANTIYKVKVELNGGYIDNLIEIEKNESISEFNVKNYSCNIWTEYSSSVFIYKTSLMNSDDLFTSFLKIGFSFDSNTNKYVVDQVVAIGTTLDMSLRISDYYILVHSDYTNGYKEVSKISLNDQIDISKDFPSSLLDSFNAVVNVKKAESEVEYYLEFKGLNTLGIPTKVGYTFLGWYLESSFVNEIIEVYESTTIYARWTIDKGEITTETILNCISDVVESDTVDELVLENDDAYFTWQSSNNSLYSINNGIGCANKVNQSHKKQIVNVSVDIKYKSGGTKKLEKQITINPIKFTNFSNTPIATYFYTGAVSSYKKYNEKYSTDGLFSTTTKEALDIVYYAFIVPNSDGSVYFQDESYIDEVRQLRNHNVRILGCVNGVGSSTSQAFKTITKDSTLRKKFINNLMDLVEQKNLDGLDLDWEAVSESLTPVASQYNLLCKELREEMTLRQDEGGSPYLLTMAVPASSYGTAKERFDFPTLNKYLDYINIMSYDLNNSTKTTHLSPLYSSKKDNGYGFSCVYGVERITSLGFDKSKLIIGCAGYGKAYKVSGGSGTYPALGVTGTLTSISGYSGSFASGTVYGNVINQLIKTNRYKQYTEVDSNGNIVGSYLYSETDKIFITYDSKEAVMAKYEYAKSIGVGMMCWAYTEDTSNIVIDAIYEAMNK